jgi:hypothetical protein
MEEQAGTPCEFGVTRSARSPWAGGSSRERPEAFRLGHELALARGREPAMYVGMHEHAESFSPPHAVSELFRLR